MGRSPRWNKGFQGRSQRVPTFPFSRASPYRAGRDALCASEISGLSLRRRSKSCAVLGAVNGRLFSRWHGTSFDLQRHRQVRQIGCDCLTTSICLTAVFAPPRTAVLRFAKPRLSFLSVSASASFLPPLESPPVHPPRLHPQRLWPKSNARRDHWHAIRARHTRHRDPLQVLQTPRPAPRCPHGRRRHQWRARSRPFKFHSHGRHFFSSFGPLQVAKGTFSTHEPR